METEQLILNDVGEDFQEIFEDDYKTSTTNKNLTQDGIKYSEHINNASTRVDIRVKRENITIKLEPGITGISTTLLPHVKLEPDLISTTKENTSSALTTNTLDEVKLDFEEITVTGTTLLPQVKLEPDLIPTTKETPWSNTLDHCTDDFKVDLEENKVMWTNPTSDLPETEINASDETVQHLSNDNTNNLARIGNIKSECPEKQLYIKLTPLNPSGIEKKRTVNAKQVASSARDDLNVHRRNINRESIQLVPDNEHTFDNIDESQASNNRRPYNLGIIVWFGFNFKHTFKSVSKTDDFNTLIKFLCLRKTKVKVETGSRLNKTVRFWILGII